MSQNTTSTDFPGTSASGGQSGSATGTASALAQEYGGKISEAASQAKDFVSDKISVVGDNGREREGLHAQKSRTGAADLCRRRFAGRSNSARAAIGAFPVLSLG